MDYIVIDLEWNQSPQGKEQENPELPFEIIEVGAVKLNHKREIMDCFRGVVRPQVYKEIHFRTKEIIQVDMKELRKGKSFPQVIKDFFEWCGSDYLFCTWGSADLTELQRNLKYYGIEGYIDKAIVYYDVQKIFSLTFEGERNPHALEYAVDFMKLEKKEQFHSALYDAEYTARIFQGLDGNIIKENYSLDYYHNPRSKEEEIHLVYENYSKDISMPYHSKEEAFEDKDVRVTECYKCRKKAIKKIRWFTGNSKTYYCLSYCREHGFLKGKIRMKKAADGTFFVVKTLKLISNQDAAGIRLQKEEVTKKRREKRRKNTAEPE